MFCILCVQLNKYSIMKNKITLAVAVLCVAAFVTSCSVEKRHYMRGYHVEWNKNKKNNSVAVKEETANTVTLNATAPVAEEQTVVETPATVNAVPVTVAPAATQENAVTSTPAVQPQVENATVKQDVAKQEVVSKQEVKSAVKKAAKNSASGDPSKGLLIVLCFLIPWLAVGLATDWEVKPLIINLLLSLTCIGAIIHAIVVVNRNVK